MSLFKWDYYWRKASYHDIAMSQGILSVLNPTSFNPKGTLLYLHFDDTGYKVTNYVGLNRVKDEILRELIEQDYCIVCGILYSTGDLPGDFMHPEFYLREAKNGN